VCPRSPYGVGKRIDLPSTRAIISRILDGSVLKSPSEVHPVFGLKFPTHVDGANSKILNPRTTWASPKAYDDAANHLAKLFIKNFQPFKVGAKYDYSKHGPVA
jgi:phosphoenolpyruvate carboxykinase (ATP)